MPAADTAQMAQDASTAPFLGGAQVLLLLVDEGDASQTELASAVALAARGRLRLVTVVALSGPAAWMC